MVSQPMSNINGSGDNVASPPLTAIMWTRAEVARRLRVHVRTVDNLIRRGDLASVRIGRRTLVSEHQVREYVRRLHEVSR